MIKMINLKKIIISLLFLKTRFIKLYGDHTSNFSPLIMYTDEIECHKTEKKNAIKQRKRI